jgi:hypothetical protein
MMEIFKNFSKGIINFAPFSLVHSFILDPTDEFIKNAFEEEELSEIIKKENGKDSLEIDDVHKHVRNGILFWIDTISFI